MSLERTFTGPLTRRQQYIMDMKEAELIREALAETAIPEKCQDCFPHLKFSVIGDLALKVVRDEMDESAAAQAVAEYTAECSGTQPRTGVADADPLCPRKEAERQRYSRF